MTKFVKALFINMFVVAGAIAAPFEEGKDYELYSSPISVSGPTVTEYFSFMCPACFKFSPRLEALKAANDGSFIVEEVPVGFGRAEWIFAADAFVYAKLFKLDPSINQEIFNRIHGGYKSFKSKSDLKEFFVSQGVDENEYDKKVNSFTTKMKKKKIEKRVKEGAVSSVPTVIVNGKYQINIGEIQTDKELIDLVNYLLKK